MGPARANRIRKDEFENEIREGLEIAL